MVKIDISQDTKDNFFNQIINQFYHFSNGKKTARKFEKKVKNAKKEKIIWSYSLSQINGFIKSKLKSFDPNITLEKLIYADYSYMSKLVDYINNNEKRTELNQNYKDVMLTLYSRLKNPEYIKDLDIKVCPYCNRNYIFNFNKSKKENATAQLDHFFDKNKYPYLAVSMYNLVPSCSTCNQRKSTKQEDIFYPYSESFNDNVKFSLKGIKTRNELSTQNIDFFDEKRIELEYKVLNNKEKVENHIDMFNIKNLYNEHKDIVSELLQKRVVYSDDYIDDLIDSYEGKLFNNKEDVLRLITGGYIEDKNINKRPLSKLIKDISEELDLI